MTKRIKRRNLSLCDACGRFFTPRQLTSVKGLQLRGRVPKACAECIKEGEEQDLLLKGGESK